VDGPSEQSSINPVLSPLASEAADRMSSSPFLFVNSSRPGLLSDADENEMKEQEPASLTGTN